MSDTRRNLNAIDQIARGLATVARAAGRVLQSGAGAVVTTAGQQIVDAARTPRQFGAVGNGVADDTPEINAMLTSLGGGGLTGRYTAHYTDGSYNITQLRYDLPGVVHRFDGNATLYAISATPKVSAVDLRAGHSRYYGMRVVGLGSQTNYPCGVHHYTNDLSLYNPGWLDTTDLFVTGFRIGIVIGAMPTQPDPILDQSVPRHEPDDIAIDAPLSELVYDKPRTSNCPAGLFMRQPNGKVTVSGGRLNSEIGPVDAGTGIATSGTWAGYSADETYCVKTAHPGSELAIIGGTLEHVQGGDFGACVVATDGLITISDVVLETTVPNYIAGTGTIIMGRMADNGINSTTGRSYLEVQTNATGYFSLSDSSLHWPNNTYTTSQPIVRTVDQLKGSDTINLNFTASFERVKFIGAPFSMSGGTYRPLVRGCRSIFRDCEVSALNGAGVEQYRYKLSDGDDILRGKVDRNGASMAAYGIRGSATMGGWDFTVGAGGYGYVTAGLPTVAGLDVTHAIKILSVGGGGSIMMTTPNLNPKRDGLQLLRAFFRTDGSANAILIRANFKKFDGTATAVTSSNLFTGLSSAFGTSWSPILFAFPIAPDCEVITIDVYAENGAWIESFGWSLT